MFGMFKPRGYTVKELTEFPDSTNWSSLWQNGRIEPGENPVTQISVKFLDGLPKNMILAPSDSNGMLYVTDKKFIPHMEYLSSRGHNVDAIRLSNTLLLNYDNGLGTIKIKGGKEFRFLTRSNNKRLIEKIFTRIAKECSIKVFYGGKLL